MAFLLHDLGQRELPGEGLKVLCALATANREMPRSLAKSQVGRAWLEAVLALMSGPEWQTCSPEDLERGIARLAQMPQNEAALLITLIAQICTDQTRSRTVAELECEGRRLPEKRKASLRQI